MTDEPGLRAAAKAANEWLDQFAKARHQRHAKVGTYDSCEMFTCRRNAEHFWAVDAALAATPAASDGSLDVERLARALGKVGNAIEIMTDEEAAEAIAAEYAESPSEGTTE